MRRLHIAAAASLVLGACAHVPLEEGQRMQEEISKLKKQNTALTKDLAATTKRAEDTEAELGKMRGLIEEATKVVTRNSADLGLTVEKMKVDMASMTGRMDEMQASVTSLTKNFTEYRASSDVKLEKAVMASGSATAPPIPEKADDIFSDAERRYKEKQWVEGRRLWDAFLARFPGDARAPKAQYLIGESYLQEQRWANAIGAFTKLIDNFPKSEMVQDAMYKNGVAFYALKYCSDARVYFQELLRRYPKSAWKKDANDQLKKLGTDAKNKAVCQQ